jgi:large subunit ribosomal protein L18
MFNRKENRQKRHKRIRAKAFGTSETPRLCVFRSNKHIHAQLIDDNTGKTILSINDIEKSAKKSSPKDNVPVGRKISSAREAGKLIAEKAIKNKIEKIVFDRGGYQYHGRIKAFAEGAREGGLKF